MHRSSSPSIDRVVKRIQSPANEVLDLELTADAVVTACTPAHTQRGFCEGDIIVSIDESFVSDRAELRGILITGKLDRVVNVTLHRQPDTDGLIGLMPLSPGARSPARKSSPEPAPLSLRSANATNTPSTEPGYDFRRKLSDKLRLVSDPSRCIVLVCDHGLNPVEQIAILALELQRPALETLTCLPTKTKARIASQDDVIEKFRRAMRTGAWLVVTKSDKSITVLSWISQLVEELREHRLAGIDRNARIILCTEPHPHFPTPLLDGATSMRVHTSSNISTLELTSVSRSNALRKYLLDATSVGPAAQASVKLNSFVSIVDIPTRDVHSRREQPVAFTPGNQSAVRLVAAVQGFANEQFYTASAAGLPGQYAIGSSLGNVFLMDHEGAALISFHAHSSAVWDISFRGQLDLVTGGEDGHGVWWTRDPAQPDSLICSDVVRQANDVYAVRHTSSGRAVGLGGYLPHVLIRSALPGQAATSHPVLMTTAVQSMSNLEGSEWLLCGGSDGSVCTIDAATGTILSNAQRHTKKCPCIATSGANMGVSGSLDGTIKLWDVREDVANSNQVIKFKFPVMGLAVSGHYLAGCVGESLHIWDVRNVEEPLGTIARAWKGTSRGVVIDAATETVVTASPDGFVRFWSFAT